MTAELGEAMSADNGKAIQGTKDRKDKYRQEVRGRYWLRLSMKSENDWKVSGYFCPSLSDDNNRILVDVPLNEHRIKLYRLLFVDRLGIDRFTITQFCVAAQSENNEGQKWRCLWRFDFPSHCPSPPDYFESELGSVTLEGAQELARKLQSIGLELKNGVKLTHEYRIRNLTREGDTVDLIYDLTLTCEPYMNGILFRSIPIQLESKEDSDRFSDRFKVAVKKELVCTEPVIATYENLSKVWHTPTKKLLVLVIGSPGSGKDQISNAIHYGRRRKGTPQTLNFANIRQEEADARLCGSLTERGDEVKGLIGEAEGGTIFIDEVHQADKGIRASLLRTLESREFMIPNSNRRKEWKDVSWVFATSAKIQDLQGKDEYGPRDFWTRMTHVLEVWHPIADQPRDHDTLDAMAEAATDLFFFLYAQAIKDEINPAPGDGKDQNEFWLSILDNDFGGERYRLAGTIARDLVWSGAKASPFAQSLCKFFKSFLPKLLVEMVRPQTPTFTKLRARLGFEEVLDWRPLFSRVSTRCLVNIGNRVAGLSLRHYKYHPSISERLEGLASSASQVTIKIDGSAPQKVSITLNDEPEGDLCVREVCDTVYDLLALTWQSLSPAEIRRVFGSW